ncbi:MAG: nitroreductase family protein [Oscillospiraceae bacterium]|nr:nitroreductase family protein [Oscillospiraceae bacterium]
MEILHNEVIDAIVKRRTVRDFSNEQITDDELFTVLTAAYWAPSGRNSQPCHVRVLQDAEALKRLNVDFKNLVGWGTPAYTRWDTNPVYHNAPTLIFIFAEGDSCMEAGLMAENIAVAAESLSIGSCIIGSLGALMNHDQGKIWKNNLDIDENYKFLIAIAIGCKSKTTPVKERNPFSDHFKIIKSLAI